MWIWPRGLPIRHPLLSFLLPLSVNQTRTRPAANVTTKHTRAHTNTHACARRMKRIFIPINLCFDWPLTHNKCSMLTFHNEILRWYKSASPSTQPPYTTILATWKITLAVTRIIIAWPDIFNIDFTLKCCTYLDSSLQSNLRCTRDILYLNEEKSIIMRLLHVNCRECVKQIMTII